MLTPRQRQAFDLFLRGSSHKEIAAELGISAGTVKLHLCAARARLGVSGVPARKLPAVIGSSQL